MNIKELEEWLRHVRTYTCDLLREVEVDGDCKVEGKIIVKQKDGMYNIWKDGDET